MRLLLLSIFASTMIAQQPPRSPVPPGGITQADLDSPLILAAKECIQKHLAILRIESILEAHTQRSAGYNVKLVCRVIEEEGKGTWEFRAHRLVNGQWRFQYASKIGD